MDYEVSSDVAQDPADHAAVVTPSDSTDLAVFPSALMVASEGDLRVTTRGGQTITMTVPAGIIPLRVQRVFATGTTATGITALW